MSLTTSGTMPHYHTNSMIGYACATNPPTVSKSSLSTWAQDTWSRTVPEKMDVKAFIRTNGFLPVRPFYRSGTQRHVSVGTCDYYQKPDSAGCVSWRQCVIDWKVFNGFAPYTDISFRNASKTDSIFLDLRNRALSGLNDKVKSMDAGLGETLSQGRQTLDMVVGTVEKLAAAARDVRHFRFRRAARRLGIGVPSGVSRRYGFSTNWLAYRYGWLPLYLDTYGTMKALWDHYHRPQIRIVNVVRKLELNDTNRVRDYSYESYLDSSLVAVNPSSSAVRWKVLRSGQAKYLVRAGYVFEYTNPNLSTLTSLGLADPLGVAWELVPLSFVIDWFVNVGEVISQLTTFNGKEMRAHYITYYFHYHVSSRSEVVSVPPVGGANLYTQFSTSPASCWERRYWVDREVFSTPQAVQLQFQNGLNPTRLLDAITLLRQWFK